MFERLEFFVRAIFHRRENFQHLIGVREAASGGEAIGLVPDEQQIQQRFLRQHGAGKRRRHGHGLLQNFAVRLVVERVEHQRVAHKKFVLKFLHDGLAGLRPAPPVDVPQRVAAPVFAQRHKFLAAPDVRRQRHAAFLIAQRARQRDGRQRIAFRQNQNRLRRGHFDKRAEQPQRVGPGNRHAGETQDSPAQRKNSTRASASPRGGIGGISASFKSAIGNGLRRCRRCESRKKGRTRRLSASSNASQS